MTTLIGATPGLRVIHAGRPDLVLEIVAQSWLPKVGDVWTCVLTDSLGAWYAADVAYDGRRLVAHSVTTHADETAARIDARRRWHDQPAPDPVRGHRTNELSRRWTGVTED
jgi:hypothetical protein